MSFPSRVNQSFLALIESGNIRYSTLPVAAAPTALVSDAAALAWAWAPYVEVVAAAVAPNPCWLCGIGLHTPAVESHNGDIAIARGAVGFEVDLAILHYSGIWPLVGVTAALIADSVPRAIYSQAIWLPYPVKVIGSPRFAVRLRKSTAVSLAGCSLKLIVATAVGS